MDVEVNWVLHILSGHVEPISMKLAFLGLFCLKLRLLEEALDTRRCSSVKHTVELLSLHPYFLPSTTNRLLDASKGLGFRQNPNPQNIFFVD